MYGSSWRLFATLIGVSLLAACAYQKTPPATMQPTQSSTYKVYFNTNQSQLTANDEATIKEVAAAVHGDNTTRVIIIGRADTVGSEGPNINLSEQRSDRVRGALIAAGVPASDIKSSGTGEKELPQVTGNNVSEALNRMVDIVVMTTTAAMPKPQYPQW